MPDLSTFLRNADRRALRFYVDRRALRFYADRRALRFYDNLPVRSSIFLPASHQIKDEKSIGSSARHASSTQHQDLMPS